MENDESSDNYLRKRKPINYDEEDPLIDRSEFSSENDAAIYNKLFYNKIYIYSQYKEDLLFFIIIQN